MAPSTTLLCLCTLNNDSSMERIYIEQPTCKVDLIIIIYSIDSYKYITMCMHISLQK